jgi:5-formyltetrahydrofolate cyclo-ligase
MKRVLRSYFRSLRSHLTDAVKKKATIDALKMLVDQPFFKTAQHIGLYHPIHDEIDLTSIISEHQSFYLPRVEGDTLCFYPFKKESQLTKSHLGIFEPTQDQPFNHPLDVLCIPALAVDLQSYRLGYGRAFFDRYVALCRPKWIVAIVYDFQYVEKLPHEAHDEKVDQVIVISSSVRFE